MKNIIWKYGLIAGAIITGVLLVGIMSVDLENLNMTLGMVVGYVSMLAAFSLVFVGIMQIRDRHLEGSISFGMSLKVGVFIVLISSVMYSLGWTAYVKMSGNNFYQIYREVEIEKIDNQEGTVEEKKEAIECIDSGAWMYDNLIFLFLFTLLEPLIPGLIITIIAALILKRSNFNGQKTA